MENLNIYSEKAIELLMAYGPKLLLALLTLFIGFRLIKSLEKAMGKIMEKRNTDATLRPFFISIVTTLLKIMLIISVMGMVGVEMTSFIAFLGAAGLAIGMALSGSLQNLAGGVMILIFKPFKIGDFIEAQGYSGVVKEIQIFNTILTTPDNRTIILPNGGLSTSSMINFSTQDKRRVDMTFGIGYNDDIDKAKAALLSLVNADERILKDPEPFIAVSALADSSVNFVVRAWVLPADYWGVFFDMQENVKKEFDKQSIGIPYPQMDVHMYNTK